MRALLFVALGGAVGSVARYGVSRRLPPADNGLPLGTLVVNIGGSFLLGLLIGLLADRVAVDLRTGLFVGLLGGFTTYSTFAFESVALARDAMPAAAVTNVVVSVVFGLLAAWAGLSLGEMTTSI